MEYVKLGNSDLRVSRICLGFGDATIGQHSSEDDIHYLEEPYVPHNLSGVMAVNKPVMGEEPVWVKASKNV